MSYWDDVPPFTPMYVFPSELTAFGLPSSGAQPDIINLVMLASTLIDEWCGRLDGDGNGSLVYTTYTQRLLLQTRNRNLVLAPIKPIVPVTQLQIDGLLSQATGGPNYYLTGCLQPSIFTAPNGMLSGLVGASGRYGYTRQDMSIAYPDLFAFINPLNLVTMFGGPAPWVPIDLTNTDYDYKTGEIWVPAGLQLQRYSEIIVTYTSGWNPNAMPIGIKMACAALTKNLMAKGDGTTALTSISLSRSGANFGFLAQVIDPTVDSLLNPYKKRTSVLMGYSGLNLGFGVQRLIDAQQRYIQNSRTPISLRYRNFTPVQNELWAQLGYILTPGTGETGTTDVQILPPPETKLMSMHNIGMSMGKLRFGAREFIISGSFVNAQQSALALPSPEKVWIGQQTVGIVAYGILYTIESYAPEEVGGQSVLWTLVTNANEQK